MKSEQPPLWFANIIISGVQTLYGLNVANRPAADQVIPLAEVWIETLWSKNIGWEQDLDSDRLHKAFRAIFGEVSEWITPAQYMQHLPPRPKQQALPPPKYPAEKARENIAKIQAMLRGKTKTMPH